VLHVATQQHITPLAARVCALEPPRVRYSSDGMLRYGLDDDHLHAEQARKLIEAWQTPLALTEYGLSVSKAGFLVVPDGPESDDYMERALYDDGRCLQCNHLLESAAAATLRACPECGDEGTWVHELAAQHPRWRRTVESSRPLYNLERVRAVATVWIVEGHRDVWALEAAGLPAVALCGAYVSPTQLPLFSFDSNYVAAGDADHMGQRSMHENVDQLLAAGVSARLVRDPWEGAGDAAELCETRGPEALAAACARAVARS
jgi:Toprim domain